MLIKCLFSQLGSFEDRTSNHEGSKDLSSSTEEALTDAALSGLNWRVQKACNRLREIRKQKYDDTYYPPMMAPLGKLHVLELALADALNDKYPSVYLVEDDVRYSVDSLDELLKVADEIIAEAESCLPRRNNSLQAIRMLRAGYISTDAVRQSVAALRSKES